jgi:hypothetical protein
MNTAYNYVIIKHNYPELERESVLLANRYNAKKKYAFIQKMVHKDGSESIGFINYSNNLEELQERANGFLSWYNYPLGLRKNIQGFINQLTT